MADTVEFFAPIDPRVPLETLIEWRYPFKIGNHGDQDDFYRGFGPDSMKVPNLSRKARMVFQEWMTLPGRTGAEFKARGVWHRTEPGRLAGYEIKMNVPTCMVGHNILLDNSVARAVELALLQFKLLLLERVTHPDAIDALDLEAVTIKSTTPTDCFDGKTREGARSGQRAFKALSELANEGGAS
jgi:hypothetical protein